MARYKRQKLLSESSTRNGTGRQSNYVVGLSEAKRKIRSCFEILNTQSEKTNYLLDDELSLADIPVGCWIHRCVVLGLEISKFKSLEKLSLIALLMI